MEGKATPEGRHSSAKGSTAAGLSVWLDAHAAAEHAAVSMARIAQAVKNGELPASTLPSGAWKINILDLDSWVANHR